MSAVAWEEQTVTSMRKRLEDIPTQIMSWAWAHCSPRPSFEDVLSMAEKMRDYKERDAPAPWPMDWQPFLTADQTRIIFDALVGHETPIEADAIILHGLREWFGPEGQ